MKPDIYPVGLLMDIKRKRVRYALRHHVTHWLKERNWRALRNYFRNGYLTEHREPCSHNAGWGWSKYASIRRAERECRRSHYGQSQKDHAREA